MSKRTPMFLAVLTLTALVTAPAFAQKSASRKMTLSLGAGVEAKGDDEGDDTPKPEGSATVAPSKDEEGGKSDAPGASHTVEKGDTLWDLSQRYLGSPWYWPKVWSYNPEIANPHWIYPGNVVRFASGAEEAPTQVEVGNGPAEEVADVDEGEMVADEERVQVAGKIGYQPKHSLTITAPSFVTPREIEESGVIKGSFSETELLTFPFQGYVEFKAKRSARVGESFVVFKTVTELFHPETKESVGYLTKLLGVVKVLKVDSKSGLATVDIVRQFDEIKRGDMIGPMGESLTNNVAVRPNERDVKGATLIAGATPYLTTFGEQQMVIVDKGSDDGVKVGNVFTAFRQSDTNSIDALMTPHQLDEAWPKEDVGACMTVEVKAKASTCLVIRSMRDMVRGEHLEMRASGAKSASRP